MNYLELTNKVIDQSNAELNPLTLINWSTAEAGKRLYPRMKGWVAEAWKQIQMQRNEWEFITGMVNTIVYPKLKYVGASAPTTPVAGIQFEGQTSGTIIQIRSITTDQAWSIGSAEGQIEFDVISGTQLIIGEAFDSVLIGGGTFVYSEKGSYNFWDYDQRVREPQWSTFVTGLVPTPANGNTSYPNPIMYVPWTNWMYKQYGYQTGSYTAPSYVSQDYEGMLVFYPQPLTPFRLSFVYDQSPLMLINPTDIPDIPTEYHDWIVWEAVGMYAIWNNNPDQVAYATKMGGPYKRKAERNLMPLPSWGYSRYDT